jgi:hypothetical protein
MDGQDSQGTLWNRFKSAFGFGDEKEVAMPPLEHMQYQIRPPFSNEPSSDGRTQGSLEANIHIPSGVVRYTSSNYRSQTQSLHKPESFELQSLMDPTRREASPEEAALITKTAHNIPSLVKAGKTGYERGWSARSRNERTVNMQKFRREGSMNTLAAVGGLVGVCALGYAAYWTYNKITSKAIVPIIRDVKRLKKDIDKRNQDKFSVDQNTELDTFANTLGVTISNLEQATKK